MCEHQDETMEHFIWDCEEYDRREILYILPENIGDTTEEKMRWIFSRERNSEERVIMNECFRRMWKRRDEILTLPSLPLQN